MLGERVAAGAEGAAQVHAIAVGRFSADDIGRPVPQGWRELSFDPEKFPKKSSYQTVRLGDEYVLRASTQGGASAVYRLLEVDWRQHPYLVWRWRVENIYPGADETTKAGDDYPGQVYICFRYEPSRAGLTTRLAFALEKRRSTDGRYPPLYVLNYVWASTLEENTWIPNPWQSRSKVVAVRTGHRGLGQWHHEARNYVDDFRAIVGEDPPPVEFIAVMIDGDGTGSSGVSYFADIELRSAPPPGFDAGRSSPPRRAPS